MLPTLRHCHRCQDVSGGQGLPQRPWCIWFSRKKKSEVTQSYLTLCDPMVSSLRGSSLHGILQARLLEWGAISFANEGI